MSQNLQKIRNSERIKYISLFSADIDRTLQATFNDGLAYYMSFNFTETSLTITRSNSDSISGESVSLTVLYSDLEHTDYTELQDVDIVVHDGSWEVWEPAGDRRREWIELKYIAKEESRLN